MKKFFLVTLINLFLISLFAQNFNISNASVNLNCTTGGSLFPDNGAGNNYSENQNLVFTVCPTSASSDVVTYAFNSGIFGSGDFLCVYDGSSTTDPLIDCYNDFSGVNTSETIRASISNATGCLTFQFSSDGDGNTGTFDATLACAPACQRLNAQIETSTPSFNADTTYIDICPDESLTITGSGDYLQNNSSYTQSDATSNFYWNIEGVLDTGQTVTRSFDDPGFYSVNLVIEDNNGCTSFNELDLKVRYAPKAEFDYQGDSVLCLNDTGRIYNIVDGDVVGGSIILGDTVVTQNSFSVSSGAVYIPDDSDNNSGNGNSTPAIYDIAVSGFQPGATISDGTQIVNICLDIEHSYIGDLDIILVAPDGTRVYLIDMNPTGGPSTNLGNPVTGVSQSSPGTPDTYCWSMTATNPAIGQNSNYTGTKVPPGGYLPEEDFDGMIGVPVNGVWQIQVLDDWGGDDGNIFGASFEFAQELQAQPDSFFITYDVEGFWDNDPDFISNPNQNEVFVVPTTSGTKTYYYNSTNNFGCIERDTVELLVEGFDVVATPEDTTICEGESVQLDATVVGETIACERDYFTYEIPYYKEEGTITPFNFTNFNSGASQSINLPFAFNFFCTSPVSFRALPDGYMAFNLNSGFSVPVNTNIPNNSIHNNIVALMWDDLVDSAGTSGYFVTGSAPNRRLVLEYNLQHEGGTAATEPVIGQIILHETSNIIDIICENCQQDADDPTASQGMENFTGASGVATPGRNNTAWSATNSAWRYYPKSTLNTDYTVFWTPNNTLVGDSTQAPFATPISSTDYIVEIQRNDNNCNYRDTVTVNVNPPFNYTISNDTAICLNSSVQLDVTGNATNIAWTPNDATINDTSIFNPTVSPDSTTSYIAYLDSLGFCPTSDTVTVSILGDYDIDSTVVSNTPCANNGSGTIEIFTSNAPSGLTYSIDGGTTTSTNNVFTNLSAGTYDIVVGAAGCDTTYQVQIVGGIPILIDSITSTNPSCSNTNDGQINVFAQGGVGNLEYSIDTNIAYQVSSQFINLTGGTYTVFVRDSLGCFEDSTITLSTPPAININLIQNDSVSCFNGANGEIAVSANGGSGTLDYAIDNVTFTSDTLYSNLSEGNYTIYVRDDNNCVDSLSNIAIEQPDSLLITNITVQNVACFGDTSGSLISFDAQGGTAPYTYAVDGTFGTNNTFNNIAAGNYQLNITDANGCTAEAIDTVITEPTQLEIVLDSTIDATCGLANGSLFLSGNGGTSPYSFSLNSNPAQNNGTFNNLSDGNYTIQITDDAGCDTSINVSLNGFPAVTVSLTNVDSTSCFGLSDGLIEVAASNGTSPFEFSIDTGVNYQTSGLFQNLAGGNYTLIVRDSIGCLDTLTQVVEQPDSLGLSATSDSVTCAGLANGTINLSASGGNPAYQFSISNDAALQSVNAFTPLDTGLYTAYVVDAKNCRDSISVNIYQPDSLLINNVVASDIDCNGDDDGVFTITATGGTPNYEYSTDNINFQTSNSISNLDGGIYTIYVRDENNCATSIVDSIFEPSVLTLDTLSTSNITCNAGSDGEINLIAQGGTSPYEYSIDGTTFQSTTSFTNLTANSYTVTVRDDNTCTETFTVILSEPNPLQVVIDSSNILCFGDTDGSITITSISGETAPYSVSFDGGLAQPYTNGLTFSGLSEGTYNITIQDANNCPNPAFTRDVNIVTPNLLEIDSIITTNPLCFGDENGTINVLTNGGGVAPYNYFIANNGDTTQNTSGVFNDLPEGDYAIWISDQNQCTDQTIDSLVAPPELFLTTDTVLAPTCFGYDNGQIIVQASGGIPANSTTPYIFTLDDGTVATANTFAGLTEGVYNITATDANNCSTSIQVIVEDPAPVFVEISPEDTLIEMGDTLALEVSTENAEGSNYIYVWSPSTGLSCSDCANPLVSIYNDEEFNLTFYDENGCVANSSSNIRVSDTLRYFIPNAFTPSSFDNTNNVFEVYGQDIKYVDMMIFNRWGEKIYESANAFSSWDGTYQGVLQNPGVYTFYVKITFLNDDVVEEKGSVTLIR